eukprot:jgi/Botrbrau1/3177/Bobra.37_2s0007.1
MTKIYVVFYSMYGHIYKLAQKVKEGIDSVEGVEGVLYQVPETLPEEVLEKMHAPPKPDIPIITVDELPNADGFAFGFPTRFGNACSAVQGLLGQHCQGGGSEATILSSLPPIVPPRPHLRSAGLHIRTQVFSITARCVEALRTGPARLLGTGLASQMRSSWTTLVTRGEHLAKVVKKLGPFEERALFPCLAKPLLRAPAPVIAKSRLARHSPLNDHH